MFAEAWRVLADDGTCWLNLGDSYSAGGGAATGKHAYLGRHLTGRRAPGIQPKNLLGLPWRVAFALQEDGWILRNAIVWHKPNAMPESVQDRLNCRHELLFLLVKQSTYWFDLDPIRIPHMTAQPGPDRHASRRATPGQSPSAPPGRRDLSRPPARRLPGLETRRTHVTLRSHRREGHDWIEGTHPQDHDDRRSGQIPPRCRHRPRPGR
jgi:site-specific DNA-methyltransferase (cytosine-N4-specific)